MNIITLTQENFDQVVAEHRVLVIDFWAEWCAPCQSFDKVIDSVATQFPNVAFAKIDIEKEPELAEEFDIRSVPAVMILCDRTVVYADTGAMTETQLTDLLDQAAALK